MLNRTKKPSQSTGHAIVIGGSIAGLLAARVLTNHFARVTVIERDILPERPEFRKGAPHARHAHGLLVRGQQIMESYFPGLTEELRAQGGIPANMGTDFALSIGGVPVKPFASDLVITACSRPLLKHTMRRRLQAMDKVNFMEGYEVVGITTDAAGARVAGVRLRQRQTANAGETQVAAALVVDASGRSSQMPKWLVELGYTPPTETTVDAKAGYASRIYRRPDTHSGTWKVLYGIPQAPQQSRGCLIAPLESDGQGERWHVTLTGLNGDHPPTDEAGFLAFARTVPVPAFYAAIAQAEPLTEPYGYQRAANRLRHYEKLPRYLEGLLAVGDSVYALNPVYGQGMTVAAIGAVTLDACLQVHRRRHATDDPTGLARRFQKQLARVNADPWQLATGQDLRWPIAGEDHKSDPISRLVQRYFDSVLAAMTESPTVAAAFARVQNMLASPATLFHPRIVWQVFRTNFRSTGKESSETSPVMMIQNVRSQS